MIHARFNLAHTVHEVIAYEDRIHNVFLSGTEADGIPIGNGKIVKKNGDAYIDVTFVRNVDENTKVSGVSWTTEKGTRYLRNVMVTENP